jgi:hypothetical protein
MDSRIQDILDNDDTTGGKLQALGMLQDEFARDMNFALKYVLYSKNPEYHRCPQCSDWYKTSSFTQYTKEISVDPSTIVDDSVGTDSNSRKEILIALEIEECPKGHGIIRSSHIVR